MRYSVCLCVCVCVCVFVCVEMYVNLLYRKLLECLSRLLNLLRTIPQFHRYISIDCIVHVIFVIIPYLMSIFYALSIWKCVYAAPYTFQSSKPLCCDSLSSSLKVEGSSQPPYSATPTKELSVDVTRIATPPKMMQLTLTTDAEGGGVGGGVRRSPRKHLKRGKGGETEREGVRGTISECKCSEDESKTKKMKKTADKEPNLKKDSKVKTLKPSKVRKAIKYLDDSEEDDEKDCARSERVGKKEQTVLVSSEASNLTCVSPRKTPQKKVQETPPEEEGYLVKLPGLTFDKDKSASPVKTPRKLREASPAKKQREETSTKTPVKPVSTPVKPVRTPVKPVSTPIEPVLTPSTVRPVNTPGSGPRPSATPKTTPTATPKLSRGSSYRSYMNRAGPKAPGSKVVPEGAENCFDGLTFVITGVLESLERDDAADIIKRWGSIYNICATKHCF